MKVVSDEAIFMNIFLYAKIRIIVNCKELNISLRFLQIQILTNAVTMVDTVQEAHVRAVHNSISSLKNLIVGSVTQLPHVIHRK